MATGNGRREALTGERAGRVLSPEIGLFLGADALRTRGRLHRKHRSGEVPTDPAGSETPGMHGNIVCGTREALSLAWPIAARSARGTRQGHGRDARRQGVGQLHITKEATEQRDASRTDTHGGGRGGKGAG